MPRLKEVLSDQNGQTVVLTALAMTALLGFMALSLDVGLLFRAKRVVRVAADSAAVAATLDYLYNNSATSAQAAGKAAASQNGVTDGTAGATVTISVPPIDGPNLGSAGFVEAVVRQPNATFFMKLFGISSVNVAARAVAGTPTAGQACIWLMAPSGTALSLQGSYNIQATGCGLYVNSPDASALKITGNGGTLNAKFLDVVGGSTSNHATSPTAPSLHTAARKNPWGNLTGPTPTNGGCTTTDTTTTSITGPVAGPGLNKAICYTKAVTISGATMGAGTYMFESGVTISGTVTVNGGTLDVYSGTFNEQSTSVLNITAPTSGTYDSIAIMQPSTNTTTMQVQFGASGQTLDGYIYAPGALVSLHDSGGGITATGIVAASMTNQTSSLTIPSYDVKHPSTTVNRVVTLVE
jgi:Flp pilus assembly protein TadG